MNYLSLAIHSIKNQTFGFILVMLELAALFAAINYTASAINERQMLIRPFADILDENSAFVYDINFAAEYAKNPAGALTSRRELLKNIGDDYECYDVMTYIDGGMTIISLSDEIFSRLKLPLAAGNRKGALGTYNEALGKRDFSVGGETLTLNVAGKLTDPTFIPTMSAFASYGFTAKDFFDTEMSKRSVILTDRSSVENVRDKFVAGLGFIIRFKSNAESNFGQIGNAAYIIGGAEIAGNSRAALADDLSSFIPLLVCLFVIVAAGVVSISVITYLRNEYRSGILWLCGCSRRQIITAHIVNILVFLTAALALCSAALGILRLFGAGSALNIFFGASNLWATLALYVFLGLLSAIIPVLKTFKTAPTEYLRRAK